MTPTKIATVNSSLIPISHPGTYLFQAPHHLVLSLDKELAIVFTIKNHPSAGLVMVSPDISNKDFISQLNLLHEKITSKLEIPTNGIRLKVFGLSHGAAYLIETLCSWASSNGVEIQVSETGRRLLRNVDINCADGKVQVTYGEINPPKSNVIFLAEGTARNRIPLSEVHNTILILTDNRVQRQLTRAAIEEYPAWAAVCPDDVTHFMSSKKWQKTHWSVVLCFDDLIKTDNIESFLKKFNTTQPSAQLRWVGSKLPNFAQELTELKLLPPMDYQLLPDFKKMLKRAVFDANLALSCEPVKLPLKKRKSK